VSIHIEASPGAIAPIVLLPGDPLRAEFAANEYLDDVTCYNRVRGMLGFTGTWNGTQVSIQGSGMGMPSLSIYAHELICDYSVSTLIRIGSCGSFREEVKLRELVIAMTASTDSAQNRIRFEGDFAPCADYELLAAACRLADERKLPFHAGGILSSDTFYQDDPESWKHWASFNVLAVEMETSALYTLAAQHGARALTICTVSDSLVTAEALSAADRQSSFGEMIRLALDTALSVH
jgi:purine-nucleoside phosphorylase